MALVVLHLLLVVPVVAFQGEIATGDCPSGLEGQAAAQCKNQMKMIQNQKAAMEEEMDHWSKAAKDPKEKKHGVGHTLAHVQQCNSLDLTLPSYSTFDPDEHDCDVSTLVMDTVAADEVMDMNELTCQTFCGKINHGDCQCDEEECDKNDKGYVDKTTTLSTIRDGNKCKDANSAHDGEPCVEDYECTMNGPMSFCTQAPETIDLALCKPPPATEAAGVALCDKLDPKEKEGVSAADADMSEYDDKEKDCDVRSSATDLFKVDAALDKITSKKEAAQFCGKESGTSNFECDDEACDSLDEPHGCEQDGKYCSKDFECTTLGPLSYCTRVDQWSQAPTVDVAICGFV